MSEPAPAEKETKKSKILRVLRHLGKEALEEKRLREWQKADDARERLIRAAIATRGDMEPDKHEY